MTNQSDLLKELKKFGLSSNQAKIYLLLVENKELRIQQIADLAHIPRSTVYECLKKLFELGIAEESTKESYKTVRPYPIGMMHHGLDEAMLKYRRLKTELYALERQLDIDDPGKSNDAVVRFYRGRSGARQILWNTLKSDDEVRVYSDWGRARYVGMNFYKNFVSESRERGIKEKVLINDTPSNLESIRQYTYPGSEISRTRLQDIRAIKNSHIKINGDTFIYGNIYSTIYLKNIEITGFEIESQQFVDTQLAIYSMLWQLAKPLREMLEDQYVYV